MGEPEKPESEIPAHLPPDLARHILVTRAPSLLEVQDPQEAIRPIADAVRKFGDGVMALPMQDGSTMVHTTEVAYDAAQAAEAKRVRRELAPDADENETSEPPD